MNTPTPARAPALIDRVLAGPTSLLVHGLTLPLSALVRNARKRHGALDPLDVRGDTPDEVTLRAAVARRLSDNDALVVLLGQEVSTAVRTVLAEVLDGQLNLPGATTRLDPSTRVIALVSGGAPDPDLSAMFPLTMAATAALRSRA